MSIAPPIQADMMLGNRYRLMTRIGRGGMGEVWQARDETLQTDVAVKLLLVPSSPEGFEAAKARFDIEQRALVSLRSPYVVRIHDRGLTEDGQPYFVMELLSGRSLQDYLNERERLETLEVLAILEDLGRAIHEPHLKGLAHRDIKPGNIFLMEYPGQRRLEVRLLDFGVAKMLSGDLEEGAVTTAGMMVGTPTYIAPEQIDGSPSLSSDIYSMGVVAYRCLTGKAPFRGDQHTVLRQHLGVAPKPFSPDLGVHPDLEELVLRMLEKQPEARPSSTELVSEVVAIRARGFEEVTPPRSDPGFEPLTPRGIFASDPGYVPKSVELEPVTGNFDDSAVQDSLTRFAPRSRTFAVALLALLFVSGVVGIAWFGPRQATVEPIKSANEAASAVPEGPDEARPKLPSPDPSAPTPAAESVKVELEAPATLPNQPKPPTPEPKPSTPKPKPSTPQAKQNAKHGPAKTKPLTPQAKKDLTAEPERRRLEEAPAKARKRVAIAFKSAKGVRVLKLRVNGEDFSSPPIRLPLEGGTEALIEYLLPDGRWQKRTLLVPEVNDVITLE